MTYMTQKAQPTRIGKVYLVGAGPGDPTLITVRGQNLLARAEVVVYDYLASSKLLRHVPKDAEFIYAGKRGGGKHTHTQDEINQILVDHALAGKNVVRLKGGDPFIFGRGGEELEVLAEHNIPFEVVPGVTSATAAATYAGVPITHRGYTSSVAFITGHEDPTKTETSIDWDKIATGVGTLVFYMGIKNLASIATNLINAGRAASTPVVVVRWASTPIQRSVVGTLADIADRVKAEGITPPALVVVGEVVQLRDKINWFEKRPLFGKRVMVTRTREQASELVNLLEEQGADVLERATISIQDPDSWAPLDQALAKLNQYDWVLFTSLNAIRNFFGRLHAQGKDARAFGSARIGVVGSATAEALQEYGLLADLVPAKFTSEGLSESLVGIGVAGKSILIPRAAKAREILTATLEQAGATTDAVPAYQNVRPCGYDEQLRQELTEGCIDVVTFTSSSTVTNFLHMLNEKDPGKLAELLQHTAIAAIGPITGQTVRDNGLAVAIQPATHTIPALVEAIVRHFAG